MKHTQPFSESRQKALLTSVQVIGLLAECIQVQFQSALVDSKFKNPAINLHAKKIKDSSEAIKLHLSSIATLSGRDEFTYEYAVHMTALIELFLHHTPEQLEELVGLVEESRKGVEV